MTRFLKLIVMFLILSFSAVIFIQIVITISSNLSCDQLILTQYVESNRISEARKLSAVQYLPNAPKLESYSGYLTVNKQYNSNLFFWFFPAMV